MKKRAKIVLLVIAIMLVAAITGIIIILRNNSNDLNKEQEWNNKFSEVHKNEISYKENTTVNELKEEIGITADNSLYEIAEEYDGRKILNIKADISYKVAFAGIIKQSKPELNEIDKVFGENYPEKNGIWISNQSRENFLKLIKENTSSEYEVDEDGYLIIKDDSIQNENDKKLKTIINSNKKIIVDINNFDYEVDVVTGEVVEYPFEKLGDIIDIIPNDNEKIIVTTKNEESNFSSREIIENFLSNI